VTPAHTGSPGAFVFAASKASDFVTGTSIPVDGGYSVQV
jgi:2-deoxy-D-gluconate 3-dehydrogenase